jgi:hypothetical protein
MAMGAVEIPSKVAGAAGAIPGTDDDNAAWIENTLPLLLVLAASRGGSSSSGEEALFWRN